MTALSQAISEIFEKQIPLGLLDPASVGTAGLNLYRVPKHRPLMN